MNTLRTTGPFFILLSSLAFSTSGTAQALAPAEATPYVIAAIRMFFGGLALLAWCAYRNILPTRHGWWRIETPLAIVGILGLQLFFFEGVKQIGVAAGTVISTGIVPISTGLFCSLFLSERLSIRWFISTCVALLGLTLLTLTGEGGITNMQGILCSVASGMFYAMYLMSSQRLLDTHKPEPLTMMILFMAGICMMPFIFFYPLAWLGTLQGMAVNAHMALITVAFAYTMFAYGLRTTSTPIASTLALAEPLCAALLGIFFLGEAMNLLSGIGMFCMFLAIIGLILPNNTETSPPQTPPQ